MSGTAPVLPASGDDCAGIISRLPGRPSRAADACAAGSADHHEIHRTARWIGLCLKRYSGCVDAGELLARVRREAGLTQAELARRAGGSQAMEGGYGSWQPRPTGRALGRVV